MSSVHIPAAALMNLSGRRHRSELKLPLHIRNVRSLRCSATRGGGGGGLHREEGLDLKAGGSGSRGLHAERSRIRQVSVKRWPTISHGQQIEANVLWLMGHGSLVVSVVSQRRTRHGSHYGRSLETRRVRPRLLLSPVPMPVGAGGGRGLQQPGGGAGGDHVLVGRVGQVDGLHSDLRRRSHVPGETLPEAEVSGSGCFVPAAPSTHVSSFLRVKEESRRWEGQHDLYWNR